ncbi:kinase-like domain-containing protein [Aspergillus varians]
MPEEQLSEYLGDPVTNDVLIRKGYDGPGPHAPEYLFYPIEYDSEKTSLASEIICVIGFGGSFIMSNHPPPEARVNYSYCAPENFLESKCGAASDIGSLAYTIHEIRCGEQLGWPDMFEDEDESLARVVTILGPYPEPWWSSTWTGRRKCFKDGKEIHRIRFHGQVLSRCYQGPDTPSRTTRPSTAEQDLLEDLLQMMLRYDPSERPTDEAVLQHPWFSFRDKETAE